MYIPYGYNMEFGTIFGVWTLFSLAWFTPCLIIFILLLRLITSSVLASPFRILEPRDQVIDEIYETQQSRTTDLETPKLWKNRSGSSR